MNKNFLLIILFFIASKAEELSELIKVNNSFITKYEYGKMLYNNPRGIGCQTCHGAKANGKKIVSFTHTANKKVYKCKLEIPSIEALDYKRFSEKINSKKNPNKKFEKDKVCEKLIYYSNIMPTYFLVEDEIAAIYHYIKNLKK